MSEFSEFIRNASDEEKEEVYGRVMDEANAEQFSVIPRGKEWEIVQHSYRRAYDYILKRVETIFTKGETSTIGELTLARAWMITDNPLLGNVSPVTMIAHGRSVRLEKFITECEKNNTPWG